MIWMVFFGDGYLAPPIFELCGARGAITIATTAMDMEIKYATGVAIVTTEKTVNV